MSESDAQLPLPATPLKEAALEPVTSQEAAATPAKTPSQSPSTSVKRSGLDLSDLKIMPAWVSDFGKAPEVHARNYDDHDRPNQRGDARRSGGPDRGRGRSSGPGSGSSSAPRGDRPAFRRPEGADRDRNGPRPPRSEGGFRDRDRRQGDGPPQREWVDIPKDVHVSVHPEDKSLDALSAHIRTTGHAFSLFDVSRLVLAGGERFGVRFLCDEKRARPLFRVPADGSLFLNRDEALQHVLHSPILESFYRIEEIELEEPKGNFPSVAICGFSGEILGPASHHSFQTSIIRLHRERFANMPLEEYKRRIRTDNDPDKVQKWKDQQRKATRWIPLSSEKEQAPPVEAPAPASPESEADSQESDTPTAPATPSNAIATRQEVEIHFKRHHADQAVVEVRDVTVHGNIDKKNLSPALFILLRQAVEAARKHLFEMSQRLSAGFDRRGLKTFKRRSGKMFVCRVRPKAIDPSTLFAERVTAIVDHLKKAPGGLQLAELLNALAGTPEPTPAPTASPVPAEAAPASTEASAPTPTAATLSDEQLAILKDLRWLANEGYIIEYSDGLVTLGVQGETPATKPAAPPKPAPAPSVAQDPGPDQDAPSPSTSSTDEVAAPSAAAEVAESIEEAPVVDPVDAPAESPAADTNPILQPEDTTEGVAEESTPLLEEPTEPPSPS